MEMQSEDKVSSSVDLSTYVDDIADEHIANPMASLPVMHTMTFPTTDNLKVVTPGDRDSSGMLWDKRIHAESRNLNKKGEWIKRRKLDEAFIAQVENELRNASASQVVTFSAPLPPAPTVEVPMPISQPVAPVSQVTEVALVVKEPVEKYPNIVVPEETRPAHTLNTFKANLMEVFAVLINSGKINTEWINEMKKNLEIKEIWNLLGDEGKLIQVYDNFCKYGLITRIEG